MIPSSCESLRLLTASSSSIRHDERMFTQLAGLPLRLQVGHWKHSIAGTLFCWFLASIAHSRWSSFDGLSSTLATVPTGWVSLHWPAFAHPPIFQISAKVNVLFTFVSHNLQLDLVFHPSPRWLTATIVMSWYLNLDTAVSCAYDIFEWPLASSVYWKVCILDLFCCLCWLST